MKTAAITLVLLFVVACLVLSSEASFSRKHRACMYSCEKKKLCRRFCNEQLIKDILAAKDRIYRDVLKLSDEEIALKDDEVLYGSEDEDDDEDEEDELEVIPEADSEFSAQSENMIQAFMEKKYIDPSLLWDKYRQALFTFINRNRKGAGTLGLQVVDEQIEANWDKYPENLNHMANKLSKFGSEYEETSLRLPEQYERFLLNIDIPLSSPQDRNTLSAIRAQLRDKLNKLLKEKELCKEDYNIFKSIAPSLSYEHFERTECPSLKVYKSELERTNGQLVELQTRQGGEYKKVLDAIANFFEELNYNWYETGTSLRSFKEKAKKGQATKFEVTFNSKTSMSETRTWTKRRRGWFRRRSHSQTERRFDSEHFNMHVKAEGIQEIQVAPINDWVDYHIVKSYKDQKHHLEKGLKFTGSEGTMPMMPKSYYVVYNPTLVMEMGKADGEYFKEVKKSSFSFGCFNSAKGSTLEINKQRDGSYVVEFKTNNHAPQIIAVDNHVF